MRLDYCCADRPQLGIGLCAGCGLTQAMDFSHVRLDHYKADDYFPVDWRPVYEREASWNLKRLALLTALLPHPASRRILDYGCGIGGFVRRATGRFAAVTGFDLSPQRVAALRGDGFSCVNHMEDVPDDVDTLVLFHVLEHVPRPWELLADLLTSLPHVDRVVLEVPNESEALISLFDNADYRRNHYSADHIWYFTNATLRVVAEWAGLRVLKDTQMQRYALGNTFGWLSQGRGGGQNLWPFFGEPELDEAYEAALVGAGVADSVFLVCEPTR
ncbi:MAG: class I SAM-dependent methyltransferase [Acidobacteriota bacterium]